MRILLAEDNETNRLLARTLLQDEGFTVEEVLTGQAAVDAAAQQSYDLILLDLSMPGLDGLSAARAIRKLPGGSAAAPILALTAHAMPGDRERCLAAGMDDHIAKPISRASLIGAISRWIGARPRPFATADGPAASGPLDAAALARLEEELGRGLLTAAIGGFIADARMRGLRIGRSVAAGDLPALATHAAALADAADTYGARHLRHCAREVAAAAAAGDAVRARALAASVEPLTEEAVEALMSRYAG